MNYNFMRGWELFDQPRQGVWLVLREGSSPGDGDMLYYCDPNSFLFGEWTGVATIHFLSFAMKFSRSKCDNLSGQLIEGLYVPQNQVQEKDLERTKSIR